VEVVPGQGLGTTMSRSLIDKAARCSEKQSAIGDRGIIIVIPGAHDKVPIRQPDG